MYAPLVNVLPPSGPPAMDQYDAPTAADRNQRVPLHTFRGEIMQAAQRRDTSRLRNMVTTLVHQHRLDASQLNACLVLHHVVWTGELNEIAEFLLQLGCDPSYPDINGDTAFHYCVRGCNIKFLKHFHNGYGNRVFEALNNNHFNLLLTAAAEASDEKAYEILNILEWLHLSGMSIESHDANGKTGLMWSCQRGSLTLVQWFLSRGANLAHRDHNGRTVLMMACLSGDEETVRTVCEKGAINLLDCESNDDRESNTALKLCWNKGHFFLGLSLRQWNFQKKTFGCMRVFKNVYAWYYWALMSVNIAIFLGISASLIDIKYEYWYHCAVFLGLFVLAQLFWLIAFASDPGYVKSPVIPDQSHRCSVSLKTDLNQRPVFSYRVTSASYKLQLLERESAKVSGELTALNRHYGVRSAQSTQLPPDGERRFEQLVEKIQKLRDQMLGLLEKVGTERCLACPPGYAKQVMDATPRRVCLTCRIVKPFRAHHCGDCAHCVHRFDHHCIWVDNCIGQGNQRSFLMFLFTLTISIFYFWILVGIYYGEEIVGKEEASFDILAQPLFYFALVNSLLNLLWAGFVGYLFGRTFKSMLTNITFYEYLKKPSHIHKRFNGKISACCWDMVDLSPLKVLKNMYMFCSGKNRWDVEDYPEYADDDAPGRRDGGGVIEPMLRRRAAHGGGSGRNAGRPGEDDDRGDRGDRSHRGGRGGQFERRPATGGTSRKHAEARRGRNGGADDEEKNIELTNQRRYQRMAEPIDEVEIEMYPNNVSEHDDAFLKQQQQQQQKSTTSSVVAGGAATSSSYARRSMGAAVLPVVENRTDSASRPLLSASRTKLETMNPHSQPAPQVIKNFIADRIMSPVPTSSTTSQESITIGGFQRQSQLPLTSPSTLKEWIVSSEEEKDSQHHNNNRRIVTPN